MWLWARKFLERRRKQLLHQLVKLIIELSKTASLTCIVSDSIHILKQWLVLTGNFDTAKLPRKSMAEYGFDPYVSVDHLIDCKT